MEKKISIESIRKANQKMIDEAKIKKYDELKAKVEALDRYDPKLDWGEFMGMSVENDGEYLYRAEVLNLFK